MKTKIFSLFLMLTISIGTIVASDTQVDGIWYYFNDYNYMAMVTYRGSSYSEYTDEYSGDVIIPASVSYNGDTYSVVVIDQSAFEGCKNLTSITIPNSVTRIYSRAFSGCSNLTSIDIPNTISTIGLRTFYRCTSLTSIVIPNNVTKIEIEAFRYCNSLVSVMIDNGVIDIEENAFANCTNLTSVILGNKITTIGKDAFAYCSSLTTITIPNSVKSIGSLAFFDCNSSLTIHISDIASWCSIDFGGLLVNHSYNLYLNNNLITDLIIPDSITSIGNCAFAYCNLTSVRMKSVIPPAIGTSTFSHTNYPLYIPCDKLETYKTADVWSSYTERIQYKQLDYTITIIPSEYGTVNTPVSECDLPLVATPDYGYHFTQWSDGNKENPRTIELTQDTIFSAEFAIDKSGVCGKNNALIWSFNDLSKTLAITGEGELTENYTFGVEAPTQLKTLIIGNDVTSIGDSAFYGMTTINHLTIGGNVASIGKFAFAECKNFDDITCYATNVPIITEKTFENVGNKQYIYLYVPEDRERAYKRDVNWGQFDIQIKGAETTNTDGKVTIVPTDNTVEITWPSVANADTYEIVITKDGEVVCTLIFNADGQLAGIAFAPSRNNTQQAQTTGFRFTVTGLTNGTNYGYKIASKNASGVTINEKSGSFTTTGGAQGIDQITNNPYGVSRSEELQITNKVIKDGQILILRGDKTYTMTGQEVK